MNHKSLFFILITALFSCKKDDSVPLNTVTTSDVCYVQNIKNELGVVEKTFKYNSSGMIENIKSFINGIEDERYSFTYGITPTHT